MTPDVLGPLVGMAAVIGFFVTVGMNIRRLRLRETPGGENFERLTEAGEQLTDEVRLMREEFADLHERVDFTERVLSEGRARNAIGPRESPPV